MQHITNNAGLGLAMAVWLAHDTYDNGSSEHDGENLISVTSILKPTRQMILASRIPQKEVVIDVADLIKSVAGRAIHDSIEEAWTTGYKDSLARLGYPKKMIEKIRINPADSELSDDITPVYLEQRYFRDIIVDGVKITISGKFDQIIDGEINDAKATSTYTYTHRNKDENYILQMSLYRWINPTKVTSDQGRIQHFFWDWKAYELKTRKNYPPNQVEEMVFNLMPLEDVEKWLIAKIRDIFRYQALPEAELPRCTPEELWMSDPVWKYYTDPAKAKEGGRATKNFSDAASAAFHLSKQGKGIVIEVQSTAKACGYCKGAPLCTQRLEYVEEDEE